jgi:mannose-6-phosphate isomerase-like protein (cupin superfamily)
MYEAEGVAGICILPLLLFRLGTWSNTMSKKQFTLRHVDDVEAVPCPCGQARRIITSADTPDLSIHRVRIQGAAKAHYHTRLTEYYHILEGTGEIVIDGTAHAVRPGDTVMIPPGTRHALRGDFEIMNIVVPPFDPQDEHVVE